MNKYDIFLFDADGTLYDFPIAEEHALRNIFAQYSLAYTEEIRDIYRKINTQIWLAFEHKEITKTQLQIVRFNRLFNEIGVDYTAAGISESEFNAKYLFELGKGTFLIDGAYDVCREIISRGKKIYIVTNGILATQESRINHSPIKDFVSGFFVSEHVGYQKPEIEYFEHVFSNIPKIDKSRILIIGDSLANDIAGGNNAGIDTCWFNPAGVENTTGIVPTYEICGLKEVERFA